MYAKKCTFRQLFTNILLIFQKDITIRIKEDKCHQETVTVVNSHIEPWFWGNILSGGVFGSTTDSSTGAMWKYDETVVVILLAQIFSFLS